MLLKYIRILICVMMVLWGLNSTLIVRTFFLQPISLKFVKKDVIVQYVTNIHHINTFFVLTTDITVYN